MISNNCGVDGAGLGVLLEAHRISPRTGRLRKLVEQCSLPCTGRAVVQRVVTDLAVLDVGAAGVALRGTAPSVSVGHVRSSTGNAVTVKPDLVRHEGAPS